MNVLIDGFYTLSSRDYNIDALFYKDYFNPRNPFGHFLFGHNPYCYNYGYQLFHYLQSNITYILVITTDYQESIEKFLILATGEKEVKFKRISK